MRGILHGYNLVAGSLVLHHIIYFVLRSCLLRQYFTTRHIGINRSERVGRVRGAKLIGVFCYLS